MKTLYIALGTLSLALGILGIFLPLLPTTPFLLLTAALYFKSSPRLYNWLLNHKHLGPYIRNFRENKAIPLRAKIISISLMWITMLFRDSLTYCSVLNERTNDCALGLLAPSAKRTEPCELVV